MARTDATPGELLVDVNEIERLVRIRIKQESFTAAAELDLGQLQALIDGLSAVHKMISGARNGS